MNDKSSPATVIFPLCATLLSDKSTRQSHQSFRVANSWFVVPQMYGLHITGSKSVRATYGHR